MLCSLRGVMRNDMAEFCGSGSWVLLIAGWHAIRTAEQPDFHAMIAIELWSGPNLLVHCLSDLRRQQHLRTENLCRETSIQQEMPLRRSDTPQDSRNVSSDATPTKKHFDCHQKTTRRAATVISNGPMQVANDFALRLNACHGPVPLSPINQTPR